MRFDIVKFIKIVLVLVIISVVVVRSKKSGSVELFDKIDCIDEKGYVIVELNGLLMADDAYPDVQFEVLKEDIEKRLPRNKIFNRSKDRHNPFFLCVVKSKIDKKECFSFSVDTSRGDIIFEDKYYSYDKRENLELVKYLFEKGGWMTTYIEESLNKIP